MMKKPEFLHVDTNSLNSKLNEKYWGRRAYKWVCLLWSQDLKIVAVSNEEINRKNWFLVC